MSTHGGNAGYEKSDAKLKPLVIFALGLAVLIALTLWFVAAVESGFERSFEQSNATHPLSDLREAPSAPELQVNPTVELAEQALLEQALLEKYAWVDRENAIVRIPIGRALKLVAERGLPGRAAAEEEE